MTPTHRLAKQVFAHYDGDLDAWLLRCREEGMSWKDIHIALGKRGVVVSVPTVRRWVKAAEEQAQAA